MRKAPRRTATLLVVTSAMLVMFAQPAFAYIDPGTGSIILQALAAAAMAVALTVRIWWKRLRDLVDRIRSRG